MKLRQELKNTPRTKDSAILTLSMAGDMNYERPVTATKKAATMTRL